MQLIVHTLDMILKNRYLELEVCRGIIYWEYLTRKFKVTFNFEDDALSIDIALYFIKNNIFSSEDSLELVPLCSVHRSSVTVEEVLECYNIVEEDQED
jgi:hypothetical protein